jgi:hypothetical protein
VLEESSEWKRSGEEGEGRPPPRDVATAEILKREGGQPVDPASLVAQMTARFILNP